MKAENQKKANDILQDVKELQALAKRVRNLPLEVLCEREILNAVNLLIIEGTDKIEELRNEQ